VEGKWQGPSDVGGSGGGRLPPQDITYRSNGQVSVDGDLLGMVLQRLGLKAQFVIPCVLFFRKSFSRWLLC
jgi:hypothetical protein